MEVPITLVAKIAAIVVHADEMMSADGHAYDRIALQQLVADPEVAKWIADLGPIAPVKRERGGK